MCVFFHLHITDFVIAFILSMSISSGRSDIFPTTCTLGQKVIGVNVNMNTDCLGLMWISPVKTDNLNKVYPATLQMSA